MKQMYLGVHQRELRCQLQKWANRWIEIYNIRVGMLGSEEMKMTLRDSGNDVREATKGDWQ